MDRLTNREREILRALGKGSTDKEIADELHISVTTVRVHVRNALRSLNATSRAHAIGILARAFR